MDTKTSFRQQKTIIDRVVGFFGKSDNPCSFRQLARDFLDFYQNADFRTVHGPLPAFSIGELEQLHSLAGYPE